MALRYTMCPMNCHPTYCGMTAEVNPAGRVEIRSNPDHPDSRGFLCQRGRHVHEIIDHPMRLLTPLRRAKREGAWSETTWDETMPFLTERLQNPESVAIWLGHGAIVSDLNRPLLFHFADTLGVTVWNPAVLCWAAGAYGLAATGIVETNTREDIAQNSEFILMWGWNVASQPTTAPFMVQAHRRGVPLAVIDCRHSEAAKMADQVYLIRPDTDAALALSMAHVILRDGYVNEPFVQQYTVGFEEFAKSVRSYTPAWGESVTGIPAQMIVDLARQYASSPASAILMGASSMFKGRNGWLASRAIACLPALTGQVGRAGAGFGPRHRGFVKALDYAGFTPAPKNGRSSPSHMEDMLKVLESGKIKTLFLFGTNFLSSYADATRAEAALEQVDCVIVHDIVLNETMKRVADVVLPGTVWVEELGLKATDSHVYLMDQIQKPAGEARSIATLLGDLATRLGRPEAAPFPTQADALNQMLKGFGSDITLDTLRTNGGQWSRQAQAVGHVDLRFHTPSTKIEFSSSLLESLGLPALPIPQFAGNAPSVPEDPYPLALQTGRSAAAFHSFYDEGRMLAKLFAAESKPVVWIHRQDAHERRICDGDDVELYNHKSTVAAKAFVTDRIVQGAVWVRDGWFGVNQLTDGESPVPTPASEGLLPIQMPGGMKRIPGGQSSYSAKVNVRPLVRLDERMSHAKG